MTAQNKPALSNAAWRMSEIRLRRHRAGFVELRGVWVPRAAVPALRAELRERFDAPPATPRASKKPPRVPVGRPASERAIATAAALAGQIGVPSPTHLHAGHRSLAGWIRWALRERKRLGIGEGGTGK